MEQVPSKKYLEYRAYDLDKFQIIRIQEKPQGAGDFVFTSSEVLVTYEGELVCALRFVKEGGVTKAYRYLGDVNLYHLAEAGRAYDMMLRSMQEVVDVCDDVECVWSCARIGEETYTALVSHPMYLYALNEYFNKYARRFSLVHAEGDQYVVESH